MSIRTILQTTPAMIVTTALAAAGAAEAGVITDARVPDNSESGGRAFVVTSQMNNDNSNQGSPNLEVIGKVFNDTGTLDVINDVAPSGFTTEYRVAETIENRTGAPIAGYTFQLGFIVNGNFVPSMSGDGLDFDAPLYDPPPSADPGNAPTVTTSEDFLTFMFGFAQPNLQVVPFQYSIDVPDADLFPAGVADASGNYTFAIRETAIPVPEPASLALLGLGGLMLLPRRRRNV